MVKMSLLDAHPGLAAQADGWDPSLVSPGSRQRLPWVCPKGHCWDASVSNRTIHGSGCPFCAGQRAIPGENDLATLNPRLAAEADGWDPSRVMPGSGKKLSWKCPEGHGFLSTPASRSSGQNCPICSGHQVLAGFNDLATHRPDLAAEANGWDPSTVTRASSKKLSWKCSKGHTWDSTVANRTTIGSNCPVCSNRKVVAGINDIATSHPGLAREAYGWDPSAVTAGSGKARSWLCSEGHVWECSPDRRVRDSPRCPTCVPPRTRRHYGSFLEEHPEAAREADGWDPSTFSPGSGVRMPWKCVLGHSWTARVNDRSRGAGCPFCGNRKVLPGFNDLATVDPGLAVEADGWDPTTVTAVSRASRRWRCREGHTWTASVGARHQSNLLCPVCAKRQVLAGFNDLGTTHPLVAAEADGWNPAGVLAGAGLAVHWRCSEGHGWVATVRSRTRPGAGSGCPVCANKVVEPRFNDLATLRPDLASQARGWDPSTVTVSSGKMRDWVCEFGHEWSAVVASRTAGRGCPICTGRTVLPGFNDLASIHPDVAAEAHGWDPASKTAGSNSKAQWRCDLGHVWTAVISSRTYGSRPNGCPYCSNKLVLAGFNDLASLYPLIAAEADGWDPSTVVSGSLSSRPWVCVSGHRWNASPSSRKRGRGCPTCASSGFDPNSDGWLYLLSHDEFGLLKVGITNNAKERIGKHARSGWVTLDVRGPMDGLMARNWESSIFEYLTARGVTVGSGDFGKFDGYTEAWPRKEFDCDAIVDLLELIRNADS